MGRYWKNQAPQRKPDTCYRGQLACILLGAWTTFVRNASNHLVTDCFVSSISLSGRIHIVHTGVTLVWRGGGGELQERGFHETTEVTFAPLSEDILQSYVASGEPL